MLTLKYGLDWGFSSLVPRVTVFWWISKSSLGSSGLWARGWRGHTLLGINVTAELPSHCRRSRWISPLNFWGHFHARGLSEGLTGGPGKSKMPLVGNTGKRTKQDPAAYIAFCLKTAKYLHRLSAQHRQWERGRRCASAQPIWLCEAGESGGETLTGSALEMESKRPEKQNPASGQEFVNLTFAGPPAGVGTTSIKLLWEGNNMVTFLWLDIV